MNEEELLGARSVGRGREKRRRRKGRWALRSLGLLCWSGDLMRNDEVAGDDGADQVMVWRRGKGFVIER